MQTQNSSTRKIVLTALFMAIGMILPFITMQIPSIGNMLLPMHLPIILCGFLCGGPYGFVAGAVVPLLRSVIFGAPPFMPTAVAMAFELATYGLVSGLMYKRLHDKKWGIYISLISAMILGRVVWAVVSIGLYSMLGNVFTWKIFVMQAVANAIPGIILQLILIPLLVYKLSKQESRKYVC